MGNNLIVLGITILLIGIIMNFAGRMNFPMLPGDILIKRENFTFYFPIVTSILVSVILTVLINLFRK